jgi:hypothetical protein
VASAIKTIVECKISHDSPASTMLDNWSLNPNKPGATANTTPLSQNAWQNRHLANFENFGYFNSKFSLYVSNRSTFTRMSVRCSKAKASIKNVIRFILYSPFVYASLVRANIFINQLLGLSIKEFDILYCPSAQFAKSRRLRRHLSRDSLDRLNHYGLPYRSRYNIPRDLWCRSGRDSRFIATVTHNYLHMIHPKKGAEVPFIKIRMEHDPVAPL